MADLSPDRYPVINSPYDEPERHWELDKDGHAIENLLTGRRSSASRTMVPKSKKAQGVLWEEGNYHEFVNNVRVKVREWRKQKYPGISPVSRALLTHWKLDPSDGGPSERLFFAQLEALETLMWLYEAPSKDTKPSASQLTVFNAEHNEDCNRLAVRMATGTGKTMVMAMIIAWHTLLYLHDSRQKQKHACTFVIITPGLTVKERLQELIPVSGNIYKQQNLLPGRYKKDINQAVVRIVNFQAFRQQDLLEGASADARKMFATAARRRGKPDTPRQEDYSSMLERVLSLPSGVRHRRIVVLNDEAHHCYGEVPESLDSNAKERTAQRERFSGEAEEERKEIKQAKQWFGILRGLHKQGRLLVAHDLSATPYYVSHQWLRFPWILSDYDLHEAMEAGLVKIPRVPVDDDTPSNEVVLRDLYKNTKPKKLVKDRMPPLIDRAMKTLYASFEQRTADWRQAGHKCLPVLIVVANQIGNATALYDWIAGYQTDSGWISGEFPMLSNVDENHQRKPNPVTMIIHSDKLEADEDVELIGQGADRMKLLTREIAKGRSEEGKASSSKRQAQYLRHILATVGKEDKPGEHIRCVVSVGMLTEGWDARTVTHILGFRAFNSTLLCEQVAGRALRRVNYQSMKDFQGTKVLSAEYSEILGIPFHFSNAQGGEPPPPPEKTIEVITQPDCEALRIQWPQVEKYRYTLRSGNIRLDPDKVQDFDATMPCDEPFVSVLAGIFGKPELFASPKERQQRVHYEFTRYALQRFTKLKEDRDGDQLPPTLRRFAQLLLAVRAWVAHPKIKTAEPWWQLISPSLLENALDSFLGACNIADSSLEVALDLAAPPLLDTADIRFETSISGEMPGRRSGPVAYPDRPDENTRRPFNCKSELNVAVCDSHLEWRIAQTLDSPKTDGIVLAWARNLRLGWTIPWLDERGTWHDYIPDFVVRMADCPRTGVHRHIVLEGKGYNDIHWNQKREAALKYWLPGVNASADDACQGRWIFLEVRPDNWMVERAKAPELVCIVSELEAQLKHLKESNDVWK